MNIGDWLLVAYRSKRSVRRFVDVSLLKTIIPSMIGVLNSLVILKAAGLRWPDCEDISTTDDEQIEKKLSPPKF